MSNEELLKVIEQKDLIVRLIEFMIEGKENGEIQQADKPWL